MITDLDRRAAVSLTGSSTPRLAVCGSGKARVDRHTVPPGAPREIETMPRAAAGNQMLAHDIVAASTTRHRDSAQTLAEDTWENEGGRLGQGRTRR